MEQAKGALIIATMDTKGQEAAYVIECLREQGIPTFTIDGGILGDAAFPCTVSREEVARAGGMTLDQVRNLGHEGKALDVMIAGAVVHAGRLAREGIIGGIMGIGGSMGTTLGTGVMRAFPLGFPKVMVTTMGSRDVRPFVRTSDIFMLHSACDLSGINRVTGTVLRNGAMALAGLLKDGKGYAPEEKPLILLSTLGTTETCALMIRKALADKGNEVLVFHTVGAGGEAMEEMVRRETVKGVIDLSLHEVMDHYFGGDYDAGPDRGRAALDMGVPAILVPGNTDFLVTGPLAFAEKHFPGRDYHVHNAAITTLRTRKREMEQAAQVLAGFCNEAKGPVAVLVPEKGFSVWDQKGGIFYDPEAVRIFGRTMRQELLRKEVLRILPFHINDPEFAAAAVEALEGLM